MKVPIGGRVLAIRDTDEATKTAHVFGAGIYAGDEIPPTGIIKELELRNPKIVLDSGEVV